MDASELKKLNWTTVSDWRELSISYINEVGHYAGKKDVDIFVQKQFKAAAKELDIAYEELEPILKEKNAEFYAEEEKLFEKVDGYTKWHPLLQQLEKMLKVPKNLKVATLPEVTVI